MPEMHPYPWNPWIDVEDVLTCQFCGCEYNHDNPLSGHRSECGWKTKWRQEHGDANFIGHESNFRAAGRVLLQE